KHDLRIRSTCIDYFITNLNDIESGPLDYPLSDHLPLYFLSKQKQTIQTPELRKQQRVYRQENVNRFRNLVQAARFDDVLETNDVDEAYVHFSNTISKHYETAFPFKTPDRPRNARKPWMTAALLKLIATRNLFFGEFKRHPNPTTFKIFQSLQKQIKRCTRKLHKEYQFNRFEKIKGNMKKTYQEINTLLGKTAFVSQSPSKIHVDGNEINGITLANKFNDFFINVGNTDVAPVFSNEYLPQVPTNLEQFNFERIDETAVHKAILALDSNCAAGSDRFKPKPLKAAAEFIAPVLTHLINLSI